MIVLAIAASALLRLVRDRTALFFMVILPVVIIVIIGSSFASQGSFRVGLIVPASSPAGERIATSVRSHAALDVTDLETVERGRTALRRGEVSAVVVIPVDVDESLAAGAPVEVQVLAQQESEGQRAAATAVSGAIAEHAAVVTAARATASAMGEDFEAHVEVATGLAAAAPPIEVRHTVADAESGYLPAGFAYSTTTMLVMFVFINAVAGSASLIESRRIGIHDRVLAGPVSPGALVVGETVTLLLISLLQSLLIVGIGALAFGVDWGDAAAATTLVALWALVGTGAGVLAGTLFRTSEQASSIGVTVGMVAGMLGGCMWPLEIVPPAMRTIGHLVPHAWAIDGWVEVLSRNGGLGDIVTQVLVLSGFAVVLLALATYRLRSRLSA